MDVDLTKLNKNVEYRTTPVKVNELKKMYDLPEGSKEDLYITVRGLSLGEMMTAKDEAGQVMQNVIAGMAAAMASGNAADITGPLEDMKHMNEVARLHFFSVLAGCINPKFEEADVAHLAKFYPGVLIKLSNAIFELTGAGPEAKKKSKSDGKGIQT
jgi:hypothetical protein